MKMHAIAALAAALLAAPCLSVTTRYMVPAGTAGNTPTSPYTSWATAANDLGSALAVTEAKDTILVRKGTYSFTGAATLTVDKHVTIRSYDPDTEAVNAAETIFDGTGFTGSYAGLGVVLTNNASSLFSLEGFTFRNFPCSALGITNIGYSITVSGCVFTDNGGMGIKGGAIRHDGNLTVVTNCQFSGNRALEDYGGAIYHFGCYNGVATANADIYVYDCSFTGGDSAVAKQGGAIHSTARAHIFRCRFSDFILGAESGSTQGAAVLLGSQTSEISDCLFTGKMQNVSYGQVIMTAANGCISNCTFTGISSTGNGGANYGLICMNAGELHNCAFTNNPSLGGGILFMNMGSTSPRIIRNCLLTDAANATASTAALIRYYVPGTDNPLVIENSTIYSSAAKISSDNDTDFAVTFRNSIVAGTFSCPNAPIVMDHCSTTATEDDFIAPLIFDYRPKSTSALVDAGMALDWHAGSIDLGGRPRVVGSAVDIGCYERQAGEPDYIIVRAVADAADRTGDWADAHVGMQAAVDAAPNGALVLVRSGEYSVGSTIVISNRVLDITSCNPATGEPDRDGTILDGQGARRIMIIHHGPHDSTTGIPVNQRRVRMEGFTFRNGYTRVDDGQVEAGQGGALLLYGRARASGLEPSSFIDCCFTNCTAFNGGAAAVLGGTFERCVFAGNSAPEPYGCGGAIVHNAWSANSAAQTIVSGPGDLWRCTGLIDCTFTNNLADFCGGVFASTTKSQTKPGSHYIAGCSFYYNFASNNVNNGGSGATVYGHYGSLVTNCTFVGNISKNYGVLHNGAQVRIYDCDFHDNEAPYGSFNGNSGVVVERCRVIRHKGRPIFGRITVRNTLFASPVDSTEMISVYGLSHLIRFENCTFVHSNGPILDCGTHKSNGNPYDTSTNVFVNCILCRTDGNSTLFRNIGYSPVNAVVITNCCLSADIPSDVASQFTVYGHQVADPRFRNAAAGDYTIRRSSPCLDAGVKLDWMGVTSIDLSWMPRVVTNARTLADDPSAMPDLGCYENQEKMRGSMISFR